MQDVFQDDRDNATQEYDFVDPAIILANRSSKNAADTLKLVKGRKSKGDISRLFFSPLCLLLLLDIRHTAAANRLLESNSVMREWAKRSIQTRKLMFLSGFICRLFYMMLLYVYEMDRRWMTNMGGISDQDVEGKIIL